ncbi:Ser/Thr protein phosphatase family protein [Talaromyces proteolyticus]|uniref:Ser/Thr protein phosphatase family protein n=1 Tax=Talaromyces proteolyticus TaxID=1131652 RepID=A0AAD4KPQ7_9EURO|nr:Ser/Thr protein phosphatase family protein [Talaromyces proteolyticus]KAH8692784.1 Ser/Thr protein phosphatase family protein [Talaromyces proteolyticus]
MVSYRKTRFVCVSDTHGYLPQEAGFSLPPGDVLIHAGDLTNTGSISQLKRTLQWIKDADYEAKIVIAGNHDVTLDPDFYAEHGGIFHKELQDVTACIDIVNTGDGSVIFLNHKSTLVKLSRPEGPRTMFKVFGSPFSRFRGQWAFGYSTAEDGERLWSQIPTDTDIVVTHTPPFGYCDHHPADYGPSESTGCRQLLDALSRIKPMLSICGHVHEGRGYERVMWSANASTVSVDKEALPPLNSKKQNLIDLTGKRHPALRNTSSACTSKTTSVPNSDMDDNIRQETCIINAAIMAKSWPHINGKQFNRPIVVDINLPIWDHEGGG